MWIVYAIWRRRYRWLAVADALMWAAAMSVATFARLEFTWARVNLGDLALGVTIAVTLHVVTGLFTGLYLGRHRLASFDEVRWVAVTALVPMTALFALLEVLPGEHLIPRSAILAANHGSSRRATEPASQVPCTT